MPLTAPEQVSPADGTIFSIYPRTTTLVWKSVSGAGGYYGDVQYCEYMKTPNDDNCSPHFRDFGIRADGTTYTFSFVGGQPGRWRVRAFSAQNGQEGPSSGWWTFTYTL
jgi:hypothetical protein